MSNSRERQVEFDAQARAVNNYRMGNISMWTVPSQLRAVYHDIVANGEDRGNIVTMTQAMYADLLRKGPATVTYPPIAYSFHALASQRAKTF